MMPRDWIASRASAAMFEVAVGDERAAAAEIARLDADDRDLLADHVETLRRLVDQAIG